ncbi:MAG: permease [Desulfosudis oleivorans]|nr:permease [Desulfosudis oleivorans]
MTLGRWPSRQPILFLLLAAAAWFGLYQALLPASEALVAWLPVDRDSHLGGALQFFFYDTPKVLLLLTGIVFVMGMVNSYFTPERTRALLAGRTEGAANVMAASLGIVTPFCSCSAVPLFIGFVQAGVPLGVTFSFLIAAPMVNEVALTLLFGLFGWKIAALYLGLGLDGGDRRRLGDRPAEDGTASRRLGAQHAARDGLGRRGGAEPGRARSRPASPRCARSSARSGRTSSPASPSAPASTATCRQDFMASFMGKDAWWAVPLAVLIGVPMYTNAAGVIPIVQALLAKGAALGTVLAFMMSVIALSAPEMIILRKVLKPRLIATFVGVVAAGILLVGFVFNAVL